MSRVGGGLTLNSDPEEPRFSVNCHTRSAILHWFPQLRLDFALESVAQDTKYVTKFDVISEKWLGVKSPEVELKNRFKWLSHQFEFGYKWYY